MAAALQKSRSATPKTTKNRSVRLQEVQGEIQRCRALIEFMTSWDSSELPDFRAVPDLVTAIDDAAADLAKVQSLLATQTHERERLRAERLNYATEVRALSALLESLLTPGYQTWPFPIATTVDELQEELAALELEADELHH